VKNASSLLCSCAKNVFVKVSSNHKQVLLISKEELRITESTIFCLPHYTNTNFILYDTNKQTLYSYDVTSQRVREIHSCRGKTISITYSECVSVAFLVQHAIRMRCVILLSVACLDLPHFFSLFNKQHDFRKKINGI
jgi:hypothetical protein